MTMNQLKMRCCVYIKIPNLDHKAYEVYVLLQIRNVNVSSKPEKKTILLYPTSGTEHCTCLAFRICNMEIDMHVLLTQIVLIPQFFRI